MRATAHIRKVTDEMKQQMAEDAKGGMTPLEISTKHKLSRSTVWKLLRAMRSETSPTPVQHQGRLPPNMQAEIRALAVAGLRNVDIATKLGISQSRVSYFLRCDPPVVRRRAPQSAIVEATNQALQRDQGPREILAGVFAWAESEGITDVYLDVTNRVAEVKRRERFGL